MSLRNLTQRRGGRFPGDSTQICMVISRSKNANLVVYEALTGGPSTPSTSLDPANVESEDSAPVPAPPTCLGLDAYWLDVDPEYVAKNRAKGKSSDRDELNFIERRMAYGVSCEPAAATDIVPGGTQPWDVVFVALPSRRMRLEYARCRVVTAAAVASPTVPPEAAGCDSEAVASPPSPPVRDETEWLPVLTCAINGVLCTAESIYVHSTETWLGPKVNYIDLRGCRVSDGVPQTERILPKDA